HRQRTALAPAVEDLVRRTHLGRLTHSPSTPASARRSATIPGNTARNRSISSSVVSRCSDTRTLPCDSTPIASSTWLGRSVDAVHDDPDDTAKPAWFNACSSASPSTYRQEKVTRWGRRLVGCPTTSTSGTVSATVVRIRSTRALSRAASASASATAARSAAAAATIAGRFSVPGLRPASRSSAGYGASHRPPLRTTRIPTPGGPPHLRALADSSDQPSGSGTRPTDCAASTYSGTPASAQAAAAASTGWSVPTSWLALLNAASATPGARTADRQASRLS